MKKRPAPVFAMWVILVIAGFFAWHLENASGAARRQVAALAGDIVAIRVKSGRLRERLARAEGMQTADKASHLQTKVLEQGGHDEGRNWLEQLSSDPQLQNRFLAYQRSKFAMTYGAFFHQRGLSPEQIAKCEDNLIMRQGIYMDLADALRAQGLAQSCPAAQQLENELMAGYTSAQTEVLGEAGFSQLDAYDQDFQWKAMVAGFAGAATLAGVPLTSAQMQQLSETAVQASKSPGAREITDLQKTYWSTVDTQAATFLTPAQIDLMKSGEFLGPFGEGSRFQNRLNNLITLGDLADADARDRTGAPTH